MLEDEEKEDIEEVSKLNEKSREQRVEVEMENNLRDSYIEIIHDLNRISEEIDGLLLKAENSELKENISTREMKEIGRRYEDLLKLITEYFQGVFGKTGIGEEREEDVSEHKHKQTELISEIRELEPMILLGEQEKLMSRLYSIRTHVGIDILNKLVVHNAFQGVTQEIAAHNHQKYLLLFDNIKLLLGKKIHAQINQDIKKIMKEEEKNTLKESQDKFINLLERHKGIMNVVFSVMEIDKNITQKIFDHLSKYNKNLESSCLAYQKDIVIQCIIYIYIYIGINQQHRQKGNQHR